MSLVSLLSFSLKVLGGQFIQCSKGRVFHDNSIINDIVSSPQCLDITYTYQIYLHHRCSINITKQNRNRNPKEKEKKKEKRKTLNAQCTMHNHQILLATISYLETPSILATTPAPPAEVSLAFLSASFSSFSRSFRSASGSSA